MLLLVAAVPYPTSLIAEYILTPSANTATAVYAGFFVLINISYNLLWYTATKNPQLLKKNIIGQTIITFRRNYLIGFPAYIK